MTTYTDAYTLAFWEDATGVPSSAIAAWLNNRNADPEDLGVEVEPEDIVDDYMGEYDSPEDYARELAEECGMVDDSAHWPMRCIDWSAAWRELRLGDGDWSHRTGHGTFYVFRSL